jgi:NAD(P)-dependent dehydrogenase (short-subunit alcohol dehydrogenase family)
MITVMGATGHTGKKIAEALLDAGQKVRALGRSEGKLAELERRGAEVLTGDVADAAFLAKAFRGAAAVYTLLPTDQRSPDYPGRQRQAGLSESFAGQYVEMTRAFNQGTVKPRAGRPPENATPTRFEDFVGELAGAYRAACESEVSR